MTHDDYIQTADPELRPRLQAIRELVHRTVPDAEERFSYQMPAFHKGRTFFYFGVFKHHIGIYPPVRDPALVEVLAPFSGPKGNLKLPHASDLPLDLLERVIRALAQQYAR